MAKRNKRMAKASLRTTPELNQAMQRRRLLKRIVQAHRQNGQLLKQLARVRDRADRELREFATNALDTGIDRSDNNDESVNG